MAECVMPKDAENQFEERGFFVVRNILSEGAVLAVRKEIERIIEVEDGFQLDKNRTDNVQTEGADAVRAVRVRNFLSEVLWKRWFTAPDVVALQKRFVGDNVKVQGTSFFTKPAQIGEGAPWHQDIWLWARQPGDPTREYKMRHLSCWIALEPVDLENGCLHVVPGIHNEDIVEHVKYDDGVHEEIPRELTEDITREPVPLHTGDAVVWHAKMWHMSPPNPSDRTRWGGVIVTLPAEMAVGAKQDNRPYLIRDGRVCDHPKGLGIQNR